MSKIEEMLQNVKQIKQHGQGGFNPPPVFCLLV